MVTGKYFMLVKTKLSLLRELFTEVQQLLLAFQSGTCTDWFPYAFSILILPGSSAPPSSFCRDCCSFPFQNVLSSLQYFASKSTSARSVKKILTLQPTKRSSVTVGSDQFNNPGCYLLGDGRVVACKNSHYCHQHQGSQHGAALLHLWQSLCCRHHSADKRSFSYLSLCCLGRKHNCISKKIHIDTHYILTRGIHSIAILL